MKHPFLLRAGLVFFTLVVTASTALAQIGAVRGLVVDANGEPIKGATIKASNPLGRPKELTATTDAKGRFAIIGLLGGVWTFVAEAPGYGEQHGEMRVRSTTLGNPRLGFVLGRSDGLLPGSLMKDTPIDIAEAGELRDKGQYDLAIVAYEEIAEKNPTLTMVNMAIGNTYRQKAGKEANVTARQPLYDRAIASYQVVLKSEPENDRAKIELAMTQVEKGNVEEAERLLTPAATATTAGREIVYSLGEIKLTKGDAAGAEPLFQRASALDPTWQRPKLKLAVIAFGKGQKDAAANLFAAVVAADATSPEAIEAGSYLKQLGR